jgi:hypothetical protein
MKISRKKKKIQKRKNKKKKKKTTILHQTTPNALGDADLGVTKETTCCHLVAHSYLTFLRFSLRSKIT